MSSAVVGRYAVEAIQESVNNPFYTIPLTEGAYDGIVNDIIERVRGWKTDSIAYTTPAIWRTILTNSRNMYRNDPNLDAILLSGAIKVAACAHHPARPTKHYHGYSIPTHEAASGEIQFHLFPRGEHDINSEHLQIMKILYRNGRSNVVTNHERVLNYVASDVASGFRASSHFTTRLRERLRVEGCTVNINDFEASLLEWLDGPRLVERLERFSQAVSHPNVFESSTFKFSLDVLPGFTLWGGEFLNEGGRVLNAANLVTCFNVSGDRIINAYGPYIGDVSKKLYVDSWLGMVTPHWVVQVNENDKRLWGPSDTPTASLFADQDMAYASSCPYEGHVNALLEMGSEQHMVLMVYALDAYARLIGGMLGMNKIQFIHFFLTSSCVKYVAQNAVVRTILSDLPSENARVYERFRLLMRLALSQAFQLGYYDVGGMVMPSITPRYAIMRLIVPPKTGSSAIQACFCPSPLFLLCFKHFIPVVRELFPGEKLIDLNSVNQYLKNPRYRQLLQYMRELSIDCPRFEYSPPSGSNYIMKFEMDRGFAGYKEWLASGRVPTSTYRQAGASPAVKEGAGVPLTYNTDGLDPFVSFLHFVNFNLVCCKNALTGTMTPKSMTIPQKLEAHIRDDTAWNPATMGCMLVRDETHVGMLFPKPLRFYSSQELEMKDNKKLNAWHRVPYIFLTTPYFASSVIGEDFRFASALLPTSDANFMLSLPSKSDFAEKFHSDTAPRVRWV